MKQWRSNFRHHPRIWNEKLRGTVNSQSLFWGLNPPFLKYKRVVLPT